MKLLRGTFKKLLIMIILLNCYDESVTAGRTGTSSTGETDKDLPDPPPGEDPLSSAPRRQLPSSTASTRTRHSSNASKSTSGVTYIEPIRQGMLVRIKKIVVFCCFSHKSKGRINRIYNTRLNPKALDVYIILHHVVFSFFFNRIRIDPQHGTQDSRK